MTTTTRRSTAERVIDQLETRGDIADRLGVKLNTVAAWIHRNRSDHRESYGGAPVLPFPEPIGHLAGSAVYWRPDVDSWLERTGRA